MIAPRRRQSRCGKFFVPTGLTPRLRKSVLLHPADLRLLRLQAKLVAYQVNADVTLKLKDFTKVAPIVQQFSDMDVTGNQSVSYTLEEIDVAKTKAVEDAYRRARLSAAAVAKAGGRTLGRFVLRLSGYFRECAHAAHASTYATHGGNEDRARSDGRIHPSRANRHRPRERDLQLESRERKSLRRARTRVTFGTRDASNGISRCTTNSERRTRIHLHVVASAQHGNRSADRPANSCSDQRTLASLAEPANHRATFPRGGDRPTFEPVWPSFCNVPSSSFTSVLSTPGAFSTAPGSITV